MRQLHRVMASLLDRALAPTEVQRFFRLARAAKKWAQNAGDFKKVIDDIVQLSKTPVAPAAPRSKKQRRGSGLSSEQGSMSEQGFMSAFNDAACSGPEAGYMTSFSGGKNVRWVPPGNAASTWRHWRWPTS